MEIKKKTKLLKIPATIALAAAVLYTAPAASFAAEGGWTEGEGSWVSTDSQQASTFAIAAATTTSSTPEKHYATFNYQDKGTYVAKRVVAHTTWKGVYHYSRARFEGAFGVSGDSGRVYDTGSTVAYSKYIDPVATVAKTYWGK
ncbi:hypothetical protein [Priestia megaterium]|uniref:hypothetical protein n=1 Tax=Priestia megaterium TaxID=1404 RepID=UPI000990611C|nr:hypothetical protein [Priestia megaterium]AQU77198.1 hypothetical protein BUW91_28790 [Priestia megaterium]